MLSPLSRALLVALLTAALAFRRGGLTRRSGAAPARLLLAKSKKGAPKAPPAPEFSRLINIAQVPAKRPVECRLLAKPAELLLLQERLDIPDLVYLAANVTVSRRDSVSVLVEGRLEARLSAGAVLSATELVRAEFDTVLLDNSAAIAKGDEGADSVLSLADEVDYDDEVPSSGDIDVGEIVAQYLSMEL